MHRVFPGETVKSRVTLPAAQLAAVMAANPEYFRVSWRHVLSRALALAVLISVLALALWRVDASPSRILNGVSELGFLIALMMPPATGGEFAAYFHGLCETLAMAFLGTVGATILAFPLGFLGARNIVSFPLFHWFFRRSFDVIRGVDTLIYALIFVAAVGLGPFAGILAIMVNDTGSLAKLFSEAVENVNRKQTEGMQSVGANRIKTVRFGVLPQVLPIFASHVLYYFESNTRSASILGVVGAGGIGLHLSERIRGNDWDEVAFIILMILVTVAVIDMLSRALRVRIIGAREAAVD